MKEKGIIHTQRFQWDHLAWQGGEHTRAGFLWILFSNSMRRIDFFGAFVEQHAQDRFLWCFCHTACQQSNNDNEWTQPPPPLLSSLDSNMMNGFRLDEYESTLTWWEKFVNRVNFFLAPRPNPGL